MLGAAMLGCSHAPLTKSINEANSNNIVAQTVNANAGNADMEPTTLDGQKAEHLLQRYRDDKGKAPKEILVRKIGQNN